VGERRPAALRGDAWTPVYDLDLRPQLDIDFVGPNWYTSTHPDSIFRRTLMAARTAPDARHALLENRLTVRRPGAETERRSLDAAELERVLAEDFGLPVTADWRPALERAVVAGAQG
jgi:N-hydroxyarylamine O-acetyltransferase